MEPEGWQIWEPEYVPGQSDHHFISEICTRMKAKCIFFTQEVCRRMIRDARCADIRSEEEKHEAADRDTTVSVTGVALTNRKAWTQHPET